MAYELQDLLGDEQIVVIVEWGDVVSHVLPEQKVTVAITQTPDGSRSISIRYPQSCAYIVKTLH